MRKKQSQSKVDPDKIEKNFFYLLRNFINRFLAAIFLFKKRKGEVVAGATTFFTILSFGPAIMILISIIGAYLNDNDSAKNHVITMIFSNFPKMDASILKAIKTLAEEQIKGTHVDFHQLFIWFFACLGISTSFIFGINTLSKVDVDGGLIQDDLRSVIFGIFLALFFLVTLVALEKNIVLGILSGATEHAVEVYKVIEWLLLPFIIFAFALVYKVSAQIKITFKDALLGAIVFILCFFAGKSTYWIYLKYFKEDLINDYGSFYNFLVAMIWVYYIICSFYLGASFSFVPNVDMFEAKKKGKK